VPILRVAFRSSSLQVMIPDVSYIVHHSIPFHLSAFIFIFNHNFLSVRLELLAKSITFFCFCLWFNARAFYDERVAHGIGGRKIMIYAPRIFPVAGDIVITINLKTNSPR